VLGSCFGLVEQKFASTVIPGIGVVGVVEGRSNNDRLVSVHREGVRKEYRLWCRRQQDVQKQLEERL